MENIRDIGVSPAFLWGRWMGMLSEEQSQIELARDEVLELINSIKNSNKFGLDGCLLFLERPRSLHAGPQLPVPVPSPVGMPPLHGPSSSAAGPPDISSSPHKTYDTC